MPEPNSGCRLWLPSVDKRGYGKAHWKGKAIRANRLALENKLGKKLPPSVMALHKCDVPSCIEERHLFPGDGRANMADKVAKGRQCRGENHNMNKLTVEQVLAIRSDDRSCAKVGADYDVSAQAVWYIRTRRNWTHV